MVLAVFGKKTPFPVLLQKWGFQGGRRTRKDGVAPSVQQSQNTYGTNVLCAAMRIAREGMCKNMPRACKYYNALPHGEGSLDVTLIRSKAKGKFLFLSVRQDDKTGGSKEVLRYLRKEGGEPRLSFSCKDGCRWVDALLNEGDRIAAEARELVSPADRIAFASNLMHQMGRPSLDIR